MDLNSIDLNYIYGILLVFGLLACKIWLLPYLRSHNINQKYYDMVEQALLLGGYMFRSEKVSKIIQISLSIVDTLEILNGLTSEQKHTHAVGELAQKLLKELNIELSKDTLDMIVRIMVSLMGEKSNSL